MTAPPEALLVVDDDPLNSDFLSRRLMRKGYEVEVADGGAQALARIRDRHFDLILLDVMMPGVNGLDVLRTVRRERSPTELPVIMATARSQSEEIVEALRIGANDYVTKPLDFPVVLARIETQLHLRRAVEAVRRLERQLVERNQALESLDARLAEVNRKMKRDLVAASRVQAALLPPDAPVLPGATFAWSFQPCDELAGDGLGVVRLDADRVGMHLLDVSGHGVAAALLSVSVARLLTSPSDPGSILVTPGAVPPEVVAARQVAGRLNRLFPFDHETAQFFTLVYGILDVPRARFQYVSAGHPGPIHVPASGPPRVLDGQGLPIGLADEEFRETIVPLGAGDRIYLYSDGITEALRSDGQPFGTDRLVALVDRLRADSLPGAVAAIQADVERWRGEGSVHDDRSILAVELTP